MPGFAAAQIAAGARHGAQRQFGMQILADLVGDAQIFEQRRRNAAGQFGTGRGFGRDALRQARQLVG